MSRKNKEKKDLAANAQELGLGSRGHLGDLIQEEGAAWASSKQPARRSATPVKAPFSWPKISLSKSVSGMAEQLTATKGPSPRGEWVWRLRATAVGAASSMRR